MPEDCIKLACFLIGIFGQNGMERLVWILHCQFYHSNWWLSVLNAMLHEYPNAPAVYDTPSVLFTLLLREKKEEMV